MKNFPTLPILLGLAMAGAHGPNTSEAAEPSAIAVSQFDGRADSVAAQAKQDVPRLRYSVGSSLFLLGNLLPEDRPYFFLLNFRYEISRRDVLFAEAITWTYYEPLGTYGSSVEHYPGKVRAFGVGAGYQRFVWKGLYATAQATPFLQQFLEADNTRIQDGFQLYLQSRIGYRFEFFKRRWFLEPSAAFIYWPINTNFPASFSAVEEGTPNYYLAEPGLHFGFRF